MTAPYLVAITLLSVAQSVLHRVKQLKLSRLILLMTI